MALNFCNNNSLSAITALPASISGGGLNLISTQTASSSSTIDFTSGIDSTYKEYIFKFINIHPATDGANFQVNFRDGGSDYDAVKTTTYFEAIHNEGDSATNLAYQASLDLAQSTSFSLCLRNLGTDNDQTASGQMYLFNPSSTTFVKHFMIQGSADTHSDYLNHHFVSGYCNTTTAIDGVQFKMASGNIDAGRIALYGIK